MSKLSFVAMDDCGLRYVLAVGHDTYLMKTLSPAQRLQYQTSGFSFSDIIYSMLNRLAIHKPIRRKHVALCFFVTPNIFVTMRSVTEWRGRRWVRHERARGVASRLQWAGRRRQHTRRRHWTYTSRLAAELCTYVTSQSFILHILWSFYKQSENINISGEICDWFWLPRCPP